MLTSAAMTWHRRLLVAAGVLILLVQGLGGIAPASALPTPPGLAQVAAESPQPPTVTAGALPTWQINGVVYSQAIVRNTVYVTGSFTRARPPGVSAGGAGEVVANNIFAFDLTTGNRVSSFNHSLNAQGLVIRASSDGSRVYVGGDFTSVDGMARGHVAAFDTLTNTLVPNWLPNVGGQVRGLGLTASTVYVGGNFTSANGVARTRLAAFATSDGAMSPWAPSASGGYVFAMTMSPDRTKVIPGGSFTTLNGTAAYGMGAVDALSGATLPWAAQEKIRTAGAKGAITTLKADGNQVYGGGYAFGAGASFEGTFGLNPANGTINWVNDCLGDTYDVAPAGEVLYGVSHYHDCSVVNSFPDTNPRVRWQKATAQTSYATGMTTKNDAYGWNFIGQPYADMLHWWPDLAFGSYTSAGQAAWAVDAAGDYVVMGGEFPRVNGVNQQGLTRMKKNPGALNTQGPRYTTAPPTATPSTTAVSLYAGSVRVTWGSAWDQDDKTLKYELLRDNAVVVNTQQLNSNFWTLPRAGYVDTGLAPGSTHTYQVRITDPAGNVLWSPKSNTVTVGTGTLSSYAAAVRGDAASHYWRLGDSGGSVVDWAGFDDAALSGGYSRGTPGAITADADPSTTFNGADAFAVNSTPVEGPNVFSAEAWFRTTSTSGGKIVSFGDRNTGRSNNYDRHIYMSPDGKVWFGVYNNGSYTVNTSNALNDGQWHHAVGTLDSSGVTLYVDGKRIGRNGGTSAAQPYVGYWRIGGDSAWNGNPYFQGDIDEVAIYPSALSTTQVQQHYTTSGRALNVPVKPADAYGAAVWDSQPDLFWRLGEANGPAALDASINEAHGTYDGGVTFGSDGAITGTTNKAVTLDGVNGALAANGPVSNPTVYSQELWFKTTTTRGGKLIGFGDRQFGNSSSYDRHVYMFDDGRLRFGVWTGQMNVIDTAQSYNNGTWHHMVATQGPNGMRLYVDGSLVGSNAQTSAQNYSGYWRVGGDTTWGGNSSDWIAASVDEVAVYSSALSEQAVAAHFTAGGGNVPNRAPTAAFTHSESGLRISVDASGSVDPDGTIASYSWNFGDTGTASGASASHSYAQAGTYEVSLTVTDNDGASASTSQQVTVTKPANQDPVASFTISATGRVVSFDATASNDPDGTIASYDWVFGDGVGTGRTITHTYPPTGGTYTVTLTVTDNEGGTSSTTRTVIVPVGQAPVASFKATASGLVVSVNGSASSDPDGTISSYAWDFGDTGTASGASATHTYAQGGTYAVTLTVTDNDGVTGSTTTSVTVSTEVVLASDAFSRTVAGGWGSADVGGSWTTSGTASRWSVSGGVGRLQLPPGAGLTSSLRGVASTDTEVRATLSTDKASTGGGQYLSVLGRVVGTADYRAKFRFSPNGAVSAWVTRMQSTSETALATLATVPGLTHTANTQFRVRLQVTGTSPTTIRTKIWPAAGTEPTAWTLTTTDNTAPLQAAGHVGFYDYMSGSATDPLVVFSTDDVWVGVVQA